MGPTGCPQTSVTNHESTLPNIAKQVKISLTQRRMLKIMPEIDKKSRQRDRRNVGQQKEKHFGGIYWPYSFSSKIY